ncbi:MAG: glycoside hydrolase family 13 protein [Flavobacteriales bacterium]
MKGRLILAVSLLLSVATLCQTSKLKVEPPFWWTKMENNKVQLLVYGDDISAKDASISELPGIELLSVEKTINPNYLFLNLEVAENCNAGTAKITLGKGRKKNVAFYEFKERTECENCYQGFSASDVMYLLMPDRFSNGDSENDNLSMKEATDRTNNLGRHGGDLKGITDHLSYIADLGATALWLNPVQENDQPVESYHGYAITDFYNVDARLGDNEQYKQLVKQAHDLDLKVVMDLVANHCGSEHWFIKDLPSEDWIYQYDSFTRSNYRGVTNVDPYASEEDFTKMKKGWFDHTMPDMNQANPLLAKYLIQNSIWWIEYAGIDGIRMDTYSYPDKDFLADWVTAIYTEYPSFNIVGEVWENTAATQTYWLNDGKSSYNSGIKSITDFVWKEAVTKAINEGGGWDTGLSRLYYALSQDRLYSDPNELLIFLDNHDVPRFMSAVGGDLDKMKLGLTLLLTSRGIPQVYYGFELGLEGWSHGEVRPEMYGGWPDHERSVFTGTGLSEKETDLLSFSKLLLNWRKSKGTFFQNADLVHYVPEEDVYVYFRKNEDQSIMVILNNNSEVKSIDFNRFRSNLEQLETGSDVISGKSVNFSDNLELAPKQSLILELK